MIANASTLTDTTLETDVCIIGAGAAGIVLAAEFLNTPTTRVVLLESGTQAPAMTPDPVYQMTCPALPVTPASRRRTFGGTTSAWAGRWKRLDPIDFRERPWVPNSGWPITYVDLLPFYDRASSLLTTPPYTTTPRSNVIPDSTLLEPIAFEFQPKHLRHWGTTFLDRFAKAVHIKVYTDAHVLGIEHTGQEVEGVRVSSGKGSFKVRAKHYVLAAGGIETPRLMLASSIGNDQVGRYYMDHPKGAFGVVEGIHPLDLTESALYEGEGAGRIAFRLSDAMQEKAKTLNSHFVLEPVAETGNLARVLGKLMGSRVSPVARVYNYLEQTPIPSNRVTLSDEKDPFGNPLACVHWDIGEETRVSADALHAALAEEVERLSIGRFRAPTEAIALRDASHHLGTTRMGSDPKTSVVNADCRVHGVNNLFVAGSAVFPTGGSAGPTATIAALSIRLADHLKTLS